MARPSAPSPGRAAGGPSGSRGRWTDQLDPVLSVGLAVEHLHLVPGLGGDAPAGEVGGDGKLAVSAVDEDREEDPPGAAEVEDQVDRGPDGASGEEHVIDEDDLPPLHGEGD